MAEHCRGRPLFRLSCPPNRGLIDLLQTLLAGLDVQQTVGERFTEEQLAELAAEFNVEDSDWGQLYGVIRRLKE